MDVVSRKASEKNVVRREVVEKRFYKKHKDFKKKWKKPLPY